MALNTADLLKDVQHIVENLNSFHERKLSEKREEIGKLKRKLREAELRNKHLLQANESLRNEKDQQAQLLRHKESEIIARERDLREHIQRADRELHNKWEILFAAQQRLGEQESAFAAEKENYRDPRNSEHTPSSTPSKGRRTISSPIVE